VAAHLGEPAVRLVQADDRAAAGPAGDGAGGTLQVERPNVSVDPDPVADVERRQRADGGGVEKVSLTLPDDAGQQREMLIERSAADQPDEQCRLLCGCSLRPAGIGSGAGADGVLRLVWSRARPAG